MSKDRSPRAERLADRIQEGAELLAAFTEKLSPEDWQKPVTQTDRRPIGVIVDHVANMYPIEVDVARGIASGKALMDVTWEAVAGINSQHATERASVSKEAAIERLRKAAREAADAIRQFSDEQLDTAAPFGLSFGAPVTAQFVIEDHALRHSWHHLAKIRAALGR